VQRKQRYSTENNRLHKNNNAKKFFEQTTKLYKTKKFSESNKIVQKTKYKDTIKLHKKTNKLVK